MFFDGAVKKRGMTRSRFVELVATNPAKLFGIYPKKGTIAVGSDADIVLFDPDERWTIRAADQHSRVDYSLFEGFEVQGRVKKTFLRGQLIVDGERWLGREGMGEFLKRGTPTPPPPPPPPPPPRSPPPPPPPAGDRGGVRRKPGAAQPRDHLLPVQPRGVHPDQRLGRRPVRRAPGVPGRDRRVRARLDPVRLRHVGVAAGRRARCRVWAAR